jgi:hypothetical protein
VPQPVRGQHAVRRFAVGLCWSDRPLLSEPAQQTARDSRSCPARPIVGGLRLHLHGVSAEDLTANIHRELP